MGTREYQREKNVEFVLSPVALWEVLLSKDEEVADEIVFYAQQVFSERLLASPSEVVVRYLTKAYPENKTNYRIDSIGGFAETWKRLANDSTRRFIFDQEELRKSAYYIRLISKNIKKIIIGSQNDLQSDFLLSLKNVIDTYYEVMKEEGVYDSRVEDNGYSEEIYYKLTILFVLLILVLRIDIVRDSDLQEFVASLPIDTDNPTEYLFYLFENYDQLFYIGPIAEMVMMAYHQVNLDKPNRGLIFDCYHNLYAPYVNYIVTADQFFSELANKVEHYSSRIAHISEIGLREVLNWDERYNKTN